MSTNPEAFPLWKANQTIEVSNNTQIQFKYILANEDFTNVQWEDFQGNRILQIKRQIGSKNSLLTIQDDYGSIENQTIKWTTSSDTEDNEDEIFRHPGKIEVSPQFKPRQLIDTRQPRQGSISQGMDRQSIVKQFYAKHQDPIKQSSNNLRDLGDIQINMQDTGSDLGISGISDHHNKQIDTDRILEDSGDEFAPSPTGEQTFFKDGAGSKDSEASFQMINEGQIEESKQDIESPLPVISETQSAQKEVTLSEKDTVIIASFRLPMSVTKAADGKFQSKSSNSMLYPTLHKLRDQAQKTGKMMNIAWIGWAGVYTEDDAEKEQITEILAKDGCIPIFFKADLIKKYLTFFQDVLQPFMHNFKGLNDYDDKMSDPSIWRAYVQVNQEFAKVISNTKEEGNLIWVNDNYLMLCPTYLRQRDINSQIALFLHCPFPSSDIFKMNPFRKEMLKSMLNCDIIGFHLFEYARHFMTACARMLGLNHEFRKGGSLHIDYYGRQVMISIGHVGIQKELLIEDMENNEYKQHIKAFSKGVFSKRHVIASIDNIMVISGITHKFKAYQKFLREYPAYKNQVVLVQFACTPHSAALGCESEYYKSTREQIETLHRQIVQEFGPKVIHLKFEPVSKYKRLALWSKANYLFVTTLKDGLCLPPLEFFAVKDILNKHSTSAIILSEFAGCAKALSGVIKVNPYDLSQKFKNCQFKCKFSFSDSQQTEQTLYAGMGIGLNYTVVKNIGNINMLPQAMVEKHYYKSKDRLIIVDHEGTLPAKEFCHFEELPEEIHQYLDVLSKDDHNKVFIISQQKKDQLPQFNSPHIGVGAENGFFYKWDYKHNFERLIDDQDFSWILSVKEILKDYTEKTDGSYIQVKESMIVWNYKDCDIEYGNMQAQELSSHIQNVFRGWPIEVVNGHGFLEVKPQKMKKRKLLAYILEKYTNKRNNIDFILYIGNDSTNEECFKYLRSSKIPYYNHDVSPPSPSYSQDVYLYTCTVGKKPTKAQYFVHDSDEIRSLFKGLAEQTFKAKRMKSFGDLKMKSQSPMSNKASKLSRASVGSDMKELKNLAKFKSSTNPISTTSGGGMGSSRSSEEDIHDSQDSMSFSPAVTKKSNAIMHPRHRMESIAEKEGEAELNE